MTIEDKLQQLRIECKNHPERRKTIEAQVLVLKIGKDYKKPADFEQAVIDALM